MSNQSVTYEKIEAILTLFYTDADNFTWTNFGVEFDTTGRREINYEDLVRENANLKKKVLKQQGAIEYSASIIANSIWGPNEEE